MRKTFHHIDSSRTREKHIHLSKIRKYEPFQMQQWVVSSIRNYDSQPQNPSQRIAFQYTILISNFDRKPWQATMESRPASCSAQFFSLCFFLLVLLSLSHIFSSTLLISLFILSLISINCFLIWEITVTSFFSIKSP